MPRYTCEDCSSVYYDARLYAEHDCEQNVAQRCDIEAETLAAAWGAVVEVCHPPEMGYLAVTRNEYGDLHICPVDPSELCLVTAAGKDYIGEARPLPEWPDE